MDAVPGQEDGKNEAKNVDKVLTSAIVSKNIKTVLCSQAVWNLQAMVPRWTQGQRSKVHLATQRECRGGHRLADTSFLQLSCCRALVLDGTTGLKDVFLCESVGSVNQWIGRTGMTTYSHLMPRRRTLIRTSGAFPTLKVMSNFCVYQKGGTVLPSCDGQEKKWRNCGNGAKVDSDQVSMVLLTVKLTGQQWKGARVPFP